MDTPRWRVAIVDDHERSRAALRGAIWSAGGEVGGEGLRCAGAGALVRGGGAGPGGGMPPLLNPLRPAELAPALDLAIARFTETRQLRRTLEDRKTIERAKGALMTRLGLTEDEAFRRLRRAAMDSRRPMVEIAKAVLTSDPVTRTLTNPDNDVPMPRGSAAGNHRTQRRKETARSR